MTDARCGKCQRRLRWGERRSDGARVTYCPVHHPHRVVQSIAIPIETEWRELDAGRLNPGLEALLPDLDADGEDDGGRKR